ncbi:MAG: addiction module protein [Candidatus Binataceae bacterium]
MASVKEILPRLLKLSAPERAKLAIELVQSLDESEDTDAAEAWLAELDRRAREVTHGTAKLEDWPIVRKRIATGLRSRRA